MVTVAVIIYIHIYPYMIFYRLVLPPDVIDNVTRRNLHAIRTCTLAHRSAMLFHRLNGSLHPYSAASEMSKGCSAATTAATTMALSGSAGGKWLSSVISSGGCVSPRSHIRKCHRSTDPFFYRGKNLLCHAPFVVVFVKWPVCPASIKPLTPTPIRTRTHTCTSSIVSLCRFLLPHPRLCCCDHIACTIASLVGSLLLSPWINTLSGLEAVQSEESHAVAVVRHLVARPVTSHVSLCARRGRKWRRVAASPPHEMSILFCTSSRSRATPTRRSLSPRRTRNDGASQDTSSTASRRGSSRGRGRTGSSPS